MAFDVARQWREIQNPSFEARSMLSLLVLRERAFSPLFQWNFLPKKLGFTNKWKPRNNSEGTHWISSNIYCQINYFQRLFLHIRSKWSGEENMLRESWKNTFQEMFSGKIIFNRVNWNGNLWRIPSQLIQISPMLKILVFFFKFLHWFS